MDPSIFEWPMCAPAAAEWYSSSCSMNSGSLYTVPSTLMPMRCSSTASTSSPVRVLWVSSACASASTPRRFSRRISSALVSRSASWSSMRSASAARSTFSVLSPFGGPPRPPPGLPTSSRRAVEYEDTVCPMPQ